MRVTFLISLIALIEIVFLNPNKCPRLSKTPSCKYTTLQDLLVAKEVATKKETLTYPSNHLPWICRSFRKQHNGKNVERKSQGKNNCPNEKGSLIYQNSVFISLHAVFSFWRYHLIISIIVVYPDGMTLS